MSAVLSAAEFEGFGAVKKSVRSYAVEPCGKVWLLRLLDGGREAGGGSFPVNCQNGGFDIGYDEAIEAGEDWAAS